MSRTNPFRYKILKPVVNNMPNGLLNTHPLQRLQYSMVYKFSNTHTKATAFYDLINLA